MLYEVITQVPHAPLEGFVRMMVSDTNEFIGVGEIDADGKVAPRRLVRLNGDSPADEPAD